MKIPRLRHFQLLGFLLFFIVACKFSEYTAAKNDVYSKGIFVRELDTNLIRKFSKMYNDYDPNKPINNVVLYLFLNEGKVLRISKALDLKNLRQDLKLVYDQYTNVNRMDRDWKKDKLDLWNYEFKNDSIYLHCKEEDGIQLNFIGVRNISGMDLTVDMKFSGKAKEYYHNPKKEDAHKEYYKYYQIKE